MDYVFMCIINLDKVQYIIFYVIFLFLFKLFCIKVYMGFCSSWLRQ